MTDRVHYHPNLIFSVGTQVVTLVDMHRSTDQNEEARYERK